MNQPVFRFAPSPNGRLHLGHAYSALLNSAFARAFGGRFLLRIEDIDPIRSKPDFEAAIYDDLAWLGLKWENPVLRQSEHFDIYCQALHGLRQRGLVYPCFCSRKTIQNGHVADTATDPDGTPLYRGVCRHLPPEEIEHRLSENARNPDLWPHTWRLALDRAVAAARAADPTSFRYKTFSVDGVCHETTSDPALWGDAVVARRDVPTSYHLSVVLDDWRQGVTHVVRGADLKAATSLHTLLHRLLSISTPIYWHHDLIVDDTGSKLSKSRLSKSLADLRSEGISAAQVKALCRSHNPRLWDALGGL